MLAPATYARTTIWYLLFVHDPEVALFKLALELDSLFLLEARTFSKTRFHNSNCCCRARDKRGLLAVSSLASRCNKPRFQCFKQMSRAMDVVRMAHVVRRERSSFIRQNRQRVELFGRCANDACGFRQAFCEALAQSALLSSRPRPSLCRPHPSGPRGFFTTN